MTLKIEISFNIELLKIDSTKNELLFLLSSSLEDKILRKLYIANVFINSMFGNFCFFKYSKFLSIDNFVLLTDNLLL